MSYHFLEGTYYFGLEVSDPANYEAPIAADSAPTFSVYEHGYGTALKGPTAMSAVSGVTGSYYGSFTMDASSGFEEGKCYRIIKTAVVGGRTGRISEWFEVDYTTVAFTAKAIDNWNVVYGNGGVDTTVTIDLLAAVSGLTAAQIRAAIGMAAANFDTQIALLGSYVDTEVGAIKAKTDQLVFDSGNLRANIKMINGVAVIGNGSTIPWGP